MDAFWEQLCRGYVDDTLSPMQRKQVELKIAAGDPQVLNILERMAGFPKEKIQKALQAREGEATPDSLPGDLLEMVKKDVSETVETHEKAIKNTEKGSSGAQVSAASQWIVRIAAGISILLILALSYAQWSKYIQEKRLEKSLVQNNELSTQIDLLQQNLRDLQVENNRFKAILSSDYGFLLSIACPFQKDGLEKAFLMLDLSTQRSLAMVRADALPRASRLSFWIQNKYGDWNLYGVIDQVNPDSVYTDFSGAALTHGRVLEVHLQEMSLDEPTYNSDHRIARTNLP